MTDQQALELRRSIEELRRRVDRLTYAVIALACLGAGGSVEALRALIGG